MKILAQKLTHISAIATVLLITKRERERERVGGGGQTETETERQREREMRTPLSARPLRYTNV